MHSGFLKYYTLCNGVIEISKRGLWLHLHKSELLPSPFIGWLASRLFKKGRRSEYKNVDVKFCLFAYILLFFYAFASKNVGAITPIAPNTNDTPA